MDPNELKQREIGFMVGAGFLLNNTQGAVRDGIKNALNLPAGKLSDEIESGDYARNSGNGPVNPCRAGWYWDYELGMCVPIEN